MNRLLTTVSIQSEIANSYSNVKYNCNFMQWSQVYCIRILHTSVPPLRNMYLNTVRMYVFPSTDHKMVATAVYFCMSSFLPERGNRVVKDGRRQI